MLLASREARSLRHDFLAIFRCPAGLPKMKRTQKWMWTTAHPEATVHRHHSKRLSGDEVVNTWDKVFGMDNGEGGLMGRLRISSGNFGILSRGNYYAVLVSGARSLNQKLKYHLCPVLELKKNILIFEFTVSFSLAKFVSLLSYNKF